MPETRTHALRMMRFFGIRELLPQVRALYQRGGGYKRAADQVLQLLERVKEGTETAADEVFKGFAVTKHGETRIDHCVKYDLSQFCRLVTVQDNGVCLLCFVGTHDDADKWLDKNRGLKPVARRKEDGSQVEKVYVSGDVTDADSRTSARSDLAEGPLYKRVPDRYFQRLVAGLRSDVVASLQQFESTCLEEELIDVAIKAESSEQATAIYDVFVSLRAGDVASAKTRIDKFTGEVVLLQELRAKEVEQLAPGEEFVDLASLPEELIAHYVKTADYRAWMLFLHPDQRAVVDRDFNGPARLSGVSGSGKTAVIVKRAVRLAEKYAPEQVLILTLNRSLAQLIRELVAASAPEAKKSNIAVTSFWEFCCEQLLEFEPQHSHRYVETTYKPNPFVDPEHVDEIWDEYFYQENNNHDADALFPLHKTLITRGVYPQDYLRQELDYVRSAVPGWRRKQYLELERVGRCIPLELNYRHMILRGLVGWEKKMEAVGVTDYLGLTTELYRYRDQLRAAYRCVLVDESQDFGTLELDLIRRLAKPQENDLFFAGDVAQQVYTKHHDFAAAGINITGRGVVIRQNYRNSREILAAAFNVLNRHLDESVRKASKLEILNPEFANFSTPKPLMLRASSIAEEFGACVNYLRDVLEHSARKDLKMCIAVCGYPLRDLELVGNELNMPVLSGSTSLSSATIFLSDLEQTKGFEFDSMCILNCNSGALPAMGMPADEQYRDLSKFYVAMTRAKTELVVSYSAERSSFLNDCSEFFVEAAWTDYASSTELPAFKFPSQPSQNKRDDTALDRTGKEFLYSRMALGLSQELQDKLIERVEGRARIESSGRGRKKQIGWVNIRELLEHPTTDDLRQLFGPESWQRISEHFASRVRLHADDQVDGADGSRNDH